MRIIFLRTICVLLFAGCLLGGTFKGLYHQRNIEQKVQQKAQVITGAHKKTMQEEIATKQTIIESQAATISRLKDVLSDAINQEYADQPFSTLKVTATAYSAREEECNAQPWITASGTPSRVGVIAVSRDLESIGVQLGDFVIVKGMGLFRVEDRMNKRWRKRIDILHGNPEAARRFAKREVEIMWLHDASLAQQNDLDSKPLS